MPKSHPLDTSSTPISYGLAWPSVTHADPIDGLLPVARLQQTVTLTLQVWEEAQPQDTYQLLWNGVETGIAKTVGNDLPGAWVTLDIPPKLLTDDGIYQVKYRARDVGGGQFTDSSATPLIVDRTPTGGALLAPLIFAHPSEPLTQEALDAAGGVLTSKLAGYHDAKWGDVIRSQWGDQPGPNHTVQAEELGGKAILIHFDDSFLQTLTDGEIQVTYTVTDRAGNVSRVSEPAVLRLQLHNRPQDIKAPVVPQAADGVMDHQDARTGVRVQLPHYTHAQRVTN